MKLQHMFWVSLFVFLYSCRLETSSIKDDVSDRECFNLNDSTFTLGHPLENIKSDSGQYYDLWESIAYSNDPDSQFITGSEKGELEGYIGEEKTKSGEHDIDGLSAIGASSQHKELYYFAPDHPTDNELFVGSFNSYGAFEVKQTIVLEGARDDDWEDLTVGQCPSGKGSCVYLSNLGDNGLSSQDRYEVYYFPEPTIKQLNQNNGQDQSSGVLKLTRQSDGKGYNSFEVEYEDGEGFNSEAIAAYKGKLFVITKRWKKHRENLLWEAKITGDKLSLKKLCQVPVGSGSEWEQVTAMDIKSGKMLYRTYRKIIEVPFDGSVKAVSGSNEEELSADTPTQSKSDEKYPECKSEGGKGYGNPFACSKGKSAQCAKQNDDYKEICRIVS